MEMSGFSVGTCGYVPFRELCSALSPLGGTLVAARQAPRSGTRIESVLIGVLLNCNHVGPQTYIGRTNTWDGMEIV